MKKLLKRIKWSVIEELEVLTGRRDPLTPPNRLVSGIGGGNYQREGREFFKYFREMVDLKPDARILDVGCGCGRMAIPLLDFLSPQGGYWGFDIMQDNIKWCRRHIQKKHYNFHFELADVYNKIYRPKGRFKASEHKFPYENNFFDFVTLTSVFSHMLPMDVKNYMREISRVLKPGGKCLATFFILNEESKAFMEQGLARTVNFPHAAQDCRLWKTDFPEAAVGYEEGFLRDYHAKCLLKVMEPIRFGQWCGRRSRFSYQDIIISEKSV